MKIKVTDKKSGLEVGKVYDLCLMAANNLIGNGQAVLEKDVVKKVEKVVTKKEKDNARKNK